METEIREALHTALRELGVTDISFSVEHPADTAHGDYATNIALVSAQALGKSPRSCAEEIVTFLGKKKIPQVERIEIAGPGFINFFLTRDFFGEKIAEAQKLKGTWGHNDSLKGQTILIEKSAPNLYKPFHIGHLLNITIGESLSRLMQSAGAVSIDMAYPSDISLGVAKAVWSLVQTGADPSDIRTLGDAYVAGTKAYEESAEAKEEIIEINKSLNIKHEGEVWDVYEKGRETSLNYFRVMTARLGSVFSDTFFESEAGILGKEIVEANMPDVFSESEGAVVFKGEDYGLHTRVFVTSLGLPLYEAKDIGLIKWKFEKYNPDLSVVITDMEQKQYFEVIKKAAELVHGEWGERSVYWQHGRLRFADGKVSSRLGNVPLAETMLEEVKQIALQKITETNRDIPDGDIDDLAEDIAVGAIKYSFLRVAAGQNIVFDFEKSLSFEGDSGPYLMYTHARIQSVLEKAADAGITPSVKGAPEQSYGVERLLYRFPEVVRTAGEERAPHLVATFLTQLAGAFNTFYAQEKIADASDEYAPYKTALAEAAGITLKNGLWMLGIKAPEKM